MIPLPQPEVIALEQFLVRRSVPIFVELDGRALSRGTGTLFRVHDRSFLITASHVFDDGIDPNAIAMPTDPISGSIVTLGPATIFRPAEANIDVAAVELKCEETIARLSANWHFLGIENLANKYASAEHYVMCGYPKQMTTSSIDNVVARPVTFFSHTLANIPEAAKRPIVSDLDLFLEYGRDAVAISGTDVDTPDLEGVSGASVWSLSTRPTQDPVWTPENRLLLVGIQTSFLHSQYVRCKAWSALAILFGNIDETLGRVVQDAVGE